MATAHPRVGSVARQPSYATKCAGSSLALSATRGGRRATRNCGIARCAPCTRPRGARRRRRRRRRRRFGDENGQAGAAQGGRKACATNCEEPWRTSRLDLAARCARSTMVGAMIGLAVAALAVDCPPQWVPSPNASFRYACHFVSIPRQTRRPIRSASVSRCAGGTVVCGVLQLAGGAAVRADARYVLDVTPARGPLGSVFTATRRGRRSTEQRARPLGPLRRRRA